MARYEDMLPDVRGTVYGAPDIIILRALRRAAQSLCKSSQCWRETLDDTYAEAGVSAYEFASPFESVVDKIICVKVDGKEVGRQVRPDDILRQPEQTGFPRMFAQHAHRQELLLWPAPGADENEHVISVQAVLSPTLRATEIPDGIVAEYQQGIVAAAKADLLLNSPGQQWHNPELAGVQQSIADQIFAQAKRAQHSGHSMLLSVVPRRFI